MNPYQQQVSHISLTQFHVLFITNFLWKKNSPGTDVIFIISRADIRVNSPTYTISGLATPPPNPLAIRGLCRACPPWATRLLSLAILKLATQGLPLAIPKPAILSQPIPLKGTLNLVPQVGTPLSLIHLEVKPTPLGAKVILQVVSHTHREAQATRPAPGTQGSRINTRATHLITHRPSSIKQALTVCRPLWITPQR